MTEENRVGRVAETMPRFLATVRHWQQATGVPVAATALVGFSQGAIMSLAATQQAGMVAACVIGLSGRFASRPTLVHGDQAIYLVHGTADAVMAPAQSAAAAEALAALGANVHLDLVPGLGHGISAEVERLVVRRLGERFP